MTKLFFLLFKRVGFFFFGLVFCTKVCNLKQCFGNLQTRCSKLLLFFGGVLKSFSNQNVKKLGKPENNFFLASNPKIDLDKVTKLAKNNVFFVRIHFIFQSVVFTNCKATLLPTTKVFSFEL